MILCQFKSKSISALTSYGVGYNLILNEINNSVHHSPNGLPPLSPPHIFCPFHSCWLSISPSSPQLTHSSSISLILSPPLASPSHSTYLFSLFTFFPLLLYISVCTHIFWLFLKTFIIANLHTHSPPFPLTTCSHHIKKNNLCYCKSKSKTHLRKSIKSIW